MKRFILKAVLFLLPMLIAFVSINEKYKSSDEWKKQNDVYKFNFVPQDIQLANVGNSHGQFNFKYDTQKTYVAFNFALSARRHLHSYNILRKYINKFSRDAVVIIPISYFEITRITDEARMNELRKALYRFLEPWYMDKWTFFDWLKYSAIPILTNDFRNVHYGATDEEILNSSFIAKNDLTDEELNEHSSFVHTMWTSPEGGEGVECGLEGFKYNKKWVSKIIELCHLHNIRPILVSTPVTDNFNSYFEKDEGFFDTFYRFTDEICSEYPDVLYFDYSHESDFSSHKELFCDSIHLNVYGAEKFTARVIADLENIGLLPTGKNNSL